MIRAPDHLSGTKGPVPRLFGGCLMVLVVHALDVALVHPVSSWGVRIGVFLAALVLAPCLWWAFVAHGRVGRTLIAGAVGLSTVAVALGVDLPQAALAGFGGNSVTGVLFGAAGLVLVGLAFYLALHDRSVPVKLIAGLFGVFVIAQWLVEPAVYAGLATHAPVPRIEAAGSLGIARARDVTFPARDGVRLSGWYVPGRSGAAVILLHGSHGSRMDTLAHLRALSGAGYAVLAYDARGHGGSAGQTNALGWQGVNDVGGAVSFLERQPGVDPHRIAALGLSMGAEEALRAAGSGVPLRAVIADGAGASTMGDTRMGGSGSGPMFVSVNWLTMRATEAISGEREPAPLASVVAQVRVPTLLIASNRSGERTIDAAYRERIGARATLWFVPDAGHNLALQKHPQAYVARVTAFLATALHDEPSTATARVR